MTENLFELFTEVSDGQGLRPIAWTGEEELSGTFRLSLIATVPVSLGDTVASQLFGQRATFVVHGSSPFVRRGVVSGVSIGGSRDVEHAELSITVVPRMDLMRLRTTSRIFSGVSTTDVLLAIAKDWQLPCELRLSKKYSKRKYITQYRETDLDFLRRIASREGIGYTLEHAQLGADEHKKPGDEKLVFFDHEQAYGPLSPGPDPMMGARLVHDRERFDAHEHHVTGFSLERRIAPEHIRLGDFDFKRPRLELRASAAMSPEQRSPINTSLGGEQLSVYLHADRAELDLDGGKAEISDELALVRLSQAQRDARIGRGKSRCLRLAPGLRFTLEEQGEAESLNQAYVVTKLTHRGRIPEASHGDTGTPVYSNDFECAPAHVVVRPPLPKLDLRQVTETATVVGPEGSDLHTDEFGRVKVKFHWDAGGEKESGCWLRVLTTWAGANWGSQFLPRVGMEVLVGFLSGDVDQPIVLGSVYNGTHPTPFSLPAEAAKSGWKTLSTPGGDGGTELTFDDTKGQERFVLRAERDLVQVAHNDFDLQIGRTETVLVEGASARTVNEAQASTVLGSRTDTIAKDFEQTVGGSFSLAVSGNSDLRVTGNRTERVEGRELYEHDRDLQHVVKADSIERILGHKITIVGEHDARRSATEHVEGSSHRYSTGPQEIVSDTEILLRCGKSTLRLTPDGLDVIVDSVRVIGKEVSGQIEEKVEIFAKKQIALVTEKLDVRAEKKVLISTEQGAKLTLATDARLDGAVVKLNCDPAPPDPLEPPEYEPPEETEIELCDDTGAPMAQRRYVLTDASGAERTGILDEDGKAIVYIEESCDIVFPDVDGARRG